MFAEERQLKIYDIICERRSVKVGELSQMLDISEVTIRRDLEELHRQNKILRTHGGAMIKYSVGNEYSVPELISSDRCIDAKRQIAVTAYNFVEENDTIIVDSSSTVYELVRLIVTGKKKGMSIITPSLSMVSLLSGCSNCKVIMPGGVINYHQNNVEGRITRETIQSLRVDKSFIGINGIDSSFGFSASKMEDAELKSIIMDSSMQNFILADSTKFGKTYLSRINNICDVLITDKRKEGYDYAWLEEQTNLVVAREN